MKCTSALLRGAWKFWTAINTEDLIVKYEAIFIMDDFDM